MSYAPRGDRGVKIAARKAMSMRLPITSIQPASDPIRKTWDEDKLNELAQSIAEQGLIVPIKVRPHPELEKWICHKHGYETLATESNFDSQELAECHFCGELQGKFWGEHEHAWFEYEEGEITPAFPFEVVYGHRRLDAMRRNGATEVECVVEGIDDTAALVQALIENVQREDLTPKEEGEAYLNLRENFGLNGVEISRRVGKGEHWISKCLGLVTDSSMTSLLTARSQTDTAHKAMWIRQALPNDADARRQVAEKVADEDLTSRQAERLAKSIAAAPSPEARKVLLETEYSPALHDPENIKARAAIHGAHDPLYRTDNGKTQQKAWDNTPEVKMIIDGVINAAKSWTMLITEIRRMVEVGKMAPEGRQFTATKLRNLAQTLSSFADELEQEKELEHA